MRIVQDNVGKSGLGELSAPDINFPRVPEPIMPGAAKRAEFPGLMVHDASVIRLHRPWPEGWLDFALALDDFLDIPAGQGGSCDTVRQRGQERVALGNLRSEDLGDRFFGGLLGGDLGFDEHGFSPSMSWIWSEFIGWCPEPVVRVWEISHRENVHAASLLRPALAMEGGRQADAGRQHRLAVQRQRIKPRGPRPAAAPREGPHESTHDCMFCAAGRTGAGSADCA